MFLNRNEAEVKQLPSGFWAVFIDGDFVDAASPSEEAAQAKLNQFLKTIKGGEEESCRLSYKPIRKKSTSLC